MDAVKVAMKFYRREEGLDLRHLNADRIWASTPQIADLSDCADFEFSRIQHFWYSVGFHSVPCSNSRCVICSLFLSDAHVSISSVQPNLQ